MIAKANPEVPNMDGPLSLDAAAVRAAVAAASDQDVVRTPPKPGSRPYHLPVQDRDSARLGQGAGPSPGRQSRSLARASKNPAAQGGTGLASLPGHERR